MSWITLASTSDLFISIFFLLLIRDALTEMYAVNLILCDLLTSLNIGPKG